MIHALNENPYRTGQNKRPIFIEKKIRFRKSGFVKTCDELIIDLQIHKRKVHPEKPVDRQNVCLECQKDFTWKGLLLHHVCFKSENDLQEKEESKFKCPDCDLVQTQRFFMIHYKVIY